MSDEIAPVAKLIKAWREWCDKYVAHRRSYPENNAQDEFARGVPMPSPAAAPTAGEDAERWTTYAALYHWECSGCRTIFARPWQKVCPVCSREDHWSGSHLVQAIPVLAARVRSLLAERAERSGDVIWLAEQMKAERDSLRRELAGAREKVAKDAAGLVLASPCGVGTGARLKLIADIRALSINQGEKQ